MIDMFLTAGTMMDLMSTMLDVIARDDQLNVQFVKGHTLIESGKYVHFEIITDISLLPRNLQQMEWKCYCS